MQEHILCLVDHGQQSLDVRWIGRCAIHIKVFSDFNPRLSHGPFIALEEDLPCPEQATIPREHTCGGGHLGRRCCSDLSEKICDEEETRVMDRPQNYFSLSLARLNK